MFQKSAEIVELVLPEDAVDGKPVCGLLHWTYGESAHADATGFLLMDEASVLENVKVLEDGRHRDVVWAGEFGDGGLSALQGGEDGSTGGIAECGEGTVEAG